MAMVVFARKSAEASPATAHWDSKDLLAKVRHLKHSRSYYYSQLEAMAAQTWLENCKSMECLSSDWE